ncbi:MAG TPA: hypothetical protein VGR45_05355 [Stellaceae bacterium]|nr:hypothetical protein [Stellaceae bacterium]
MSEARIAADMAAMGVDPAPESVPAPEPAPEPAPSGTAADLAPTSDQEVDPAPAPGAPVDPEPEPAPAAKPTASDRIHELTAARRAERARADQAERQNRELRETLDRMNATLERLAPATTAAPPPAEAQRPKREEFGDPDEYQVALTDWAAERHARRIAADFRAQQEEQRREAEAAATRQRQEEQQRTVHQGYQSRRAEFMKEHPDYVDIAENEGTPASGPMLQVLLTHEQGPAIAYWLGQNQDEAARIANLPDPAMQLVEMGMIAASVRRPNGRVAQPATPRPAPIVPIRSTGSAAPRSVNDMSMDEVMASVQAEANARAKSGGRL